MSRKLERRTSRLGHSEPMGQELKDHKAARRVSDLSARKQEGEEDFGEPLAEISSTPASSVGAGTPVSDAANCSFAADDHDNASPTPSSSAQEGSKKSGGKPLRLFSNFDTSPDFGPTNAKTQNRGAVPVKARSARDLDDAISLRKRRAILDQQQHGVATPISSGASTPRPDFQTTTTTTTSSLNPPQTTSTGDDFFSNQKGKDFDIDKFRMNALHKVKGENPVVEKVPFEYSPTGKDHHHRVNDPRPREEENIRRGVIDDSKEALSEDQSTAPRTSIKGTESTTTTQEKADAFLLALIWSLFFRLPFALLNSVRSKAVSLINFSIWVLVMVRDHIVAPKKIKDHGKEEEYDITATQVTLAKMQVHLESRKYSSS